GVGGPEPLAGRGIPDGQPALNLRTVIPAPRGDPRAVGADGQALDRAGQPAERAPIVAGGRIPEPDLGRIGRPGLTEGMPGPRGDPCTVGAEGQALDALAKPRAHEILAMAPKSQALEVGQPIDVVPLPTAEVNRAPLEQVLGQGDVIVLH